MTGVLLALHGATKVITGSVISTHHSLDEQRICPAAK